MGYGLGREWHLDYNFPKFKRVTQTLTLLKNVGMPYAILKFGSSFWNKVGFHNIGIDRWLDDYWYKFSKEEKERIIVSIAGTDFALEMLIECLNDVCLNAAGIELNYSCPNVRDNKNRFTPKYISDRLPVYLKLNYLQDPYSYDLDCISGIRVNSVPKYFGGVSGKIAQKHNWEFIKKFNKEGLNVAGCSCVTMDDIYYMEDLGCKEVGIGTVIIANPKLVEGLKCD